MKRWAAPWAIAMWLGTASAALGEPPSDSGAQPSGDPLARAERAYLEVDFAAVRAQTASAIERGGYDPEDLARIYALRGIALAALGEGEAARESFARMLAVDPTSHVSADLAPRLRAPFLEARGAWSARRRQLGAELEWSSATSSLLLSVRDPLGMVARVELRVRPGAEGEFEAHERPSAAEIQIPVDAPQVEVYGALLDAHGNRVRALGSPERPVRLGRRAERSVPSPRDSAATAAPEGGAGAPLAAREGVVETASRTGETPADAEERPLWRSPWLWVGVGVALAAGAAGLGLGLRERELQLRTDVTTDPGR